MPAVLLSSIALACPLIKSCVELSKSCCGSRRQWSQSCQRTLTAFRQKSLIPGDNKQLSNDPGNALRDFLLRLKNGDSRRYPRFSAKAMLSAVAAATRQKQDVIQELADRSQKRRDIGQSRRRQNSAGAAGFGNGRQPGGTEHSPGTG